MLQCPRLTASTRLGEACCGVRLVIPSAVLTAVRAGLFVDGFALDHKDLPDMGEVEIGIERRAAPNTPRLDAAMIRRRDLDEIGGAARLEQQDDIAFQRRLVALDSEMIVRLLLDQVGGHCALGQQGIARDVLACDVAAF